MPLLSVFGNDAFSAAELSQAINMVPNQVGLIQRLNLMPARPVSTTMVAVESAGSTLTLLPMRARGGPPSLGVPERRNIKGFAIPHIPHDDMILAADLQNMLAWATTDAEQLQQAADAINRKQIVMRTKHGLTLEWLRVTALRGTIMDNDGSVVLNLFSEYGITEHVVDFALDTDTTDVGALARSVARYMEDNLAGETMTGVLALCSPEFFDALVSHPSVTEAYKYFSAQQNILREDVRSGFVFAGIQWVEYAGSASAMNEDGTYTTHPYIPPGDARFVPLGTNDTFMTFFGPADFIDTINRPGLEVYSRIAVDPEFNRWVKIHTQSNPLPFVRRPALLVRGTV